MSANKTSGPVMRAAPVVNASILHRAVGGVLSSLRTRMNRALREPIGHPTRPMDELEKRLLFAQLSFSPLDPTGARIYQAGATDAISVSGEVDQYEVALAPGQKLSAQVIPTPGSGLRPVVTILSEDGTVVYDSATAPASGTRAIVQPVDLALGGNYRIDVTDASGTSGGYKIETFLHAYLENENVGATDNDTLVGAVNLNGQTTLLQGTGRLAAAVGTADGNTKRDLYRIDLAAGEAFSALLDRQGDGFGQFAFENTFNIVSGYNYAVGTGDFNADGFADVVVGGESSAAEGLRVLLSDGNGGLTPVDWGTPNTIYDLAIADFDGDGNLDIATVALSYSYPYEGTGESTRLTIYLGDGTGGAASSYDRYLAESGYSIATGDLDNDGNADLVVGMNNYVPVASEVPTEITDLGTVVVLLGDGSGNFDAGKYYSVQGKVYDVAIVDLDNDGYADIIVGQGDADGNEGWITRLKMSSFNPGFVEYSATDWHQNPIIRIAGGDFDGSGSGDYLGLHLYSGDVSVTLTSPSGDPSTFYTFQPHSNQFGEQSAVVLADVNRDGVLDLLTSTGGYGSQDDSIHVTLNDGNGFFFSGTSSFDKMGEYVGPFGAADLNGDGDVDLIGISTNVDYDEDLEENVVQVSTRLGLGEVNFELLDSTGAKILLPGGGGFNAYRGILDYISPSGGPVYLSVSGDVGQRYQIALTGGAKFGLDPELIDNRPQDMTVAGQIASRVQYNGETDIYTVSLVSGDVIDVNVIARNLGVDAPGGNLVPVVELLNPSGTVVASDLNPTDANTAGFNYSVTATGTYKVRITSKSGAGDYDVTVTGQTGATSPFTVQSITPSDGSTVGYRPWVGVKFSQPVLLTSVQPGDLLVNGQPATGISPNDGYEIFFHTSDLFPTDGMYTITIPAGAIVSSFGQVLGAQTFSFTVDAIGPQVTSSTLSQNQTIAPGPLTWNASFDEELSTILILGMFAQTILDNGDVQTTNLSSGSSVDLSQMQYVTTGPNFGPTELGFSYQNLLEGRYEVRLKSGFHGEFQIGFVGTGPGGQNDFQALDGEFNGTYPSGDGNSGGDFVLNFNVDAPGITPLTTLSARAPVGSIVHELSTARAFHETGDADSFSISLDPNQQITLMLVPTGGAATAKLDLRDPSGTLLATSTGAAGETVVLQSVNGTNGGLYQIDATSLSGIGGYTLRVIINAAAEGEIAGTGNNNSRATAEALITRQLTGGFPGVRAAVVGDATASDDYYKLDLLAGQPASFALSGIEGGVVQFRLENAAGNLITLGAGGQGNADQTAIDFLPTSAGTYYLVVSGTGRYNLLATVNASFERELFPVADPAQDLSVAKQVVGHLKGGPVTASSPIDVLQVGPNTASFGGNLDRLIDQLNDDSFHNFTATRTNVAGADTFEELAPYDVVILTQLSSSQYTPGLASALKKFVELGGAVIVSGSITQTFSGATISPFAQLLPFVPASGVGSTFGTLTPTAAHPITNLYNPTAFPVASYYPVAVVSGATIVATNGANPTVIVRENIGFGGRTIFLGPEYADQFNSTTLRTGNPDRLLEQALAYAAGSGDQSDVYSLSLNAGDSIVLTTSTPNSETALPVNLIDPILDLYSPAGVLVASNDNGPDGRNSRINYTATTAGAYRVVVRAKETDGGAYTLQVTGAAGSTLVIAPKVVSTTPSTSPLSNAPGTIDVVLSENILASSVQTSDLSIIGGTVTGAQLIDGRTVRFSINVADVDTTYAYSLPAGAFTDLQGDLSDAYASTFAIDKIGPRVIGSNPASQASSPFTSWSFTFSEELQPLPSSYNYSSLFDITRPNGTTIESWFINNVVINGNTFTINLSPQTAAGNYTVALKPALFKDLRGNVMDQDQDGTGGEAIEDRFNSTITIASPNLVVDSVEVLNTPVFGSPVTVRWTVRNAGTDPAADGWQDRLYFSADGTVDGGDLILLTIGTPTVPLAPGQTYTRTETVNLPLNVSVVPGNYQFIVRTDRSNTQQESNENDNTTASLITPVSLPVLPDLEVSNVQVTPPTPLSGGQATMQWTLTNTGTQGVTGVLRDRVWISGDSAIGGDLSIGEFDYAVNLAPGASVARSALVTIPINQFGEKWFVVQTDAFNVVFEHTNEANNFAITPAVVNVTLAPVPDLQVTAITAPANVTSGTSPTITWTLANNGTADFTGTINENIFLSPDGSIGDDEFFKTVSFTGTIPAGGSITRASTIDIPISYSGSRHVVITTDASNTVFEDLGESNNTTIDDQPMLVTIPPTPDLIVSSITAPLTAQSATAMTIQWQVTNQGAAPTSGTFTETVYLSSDASIGNDQAFGSFTFTGSIAPGQTVNRSQTIQLPNVYEGTFRAVVITDSSNSIFENTNEGNNALLGDTDIQITQSPFPNLIVSNIVAPPTAASEETIQIDWVVTNTGNASTSAPAWYDRVYLSADDTFGGTDTVLATVQNASYLNAGESYAQSATVTLPQGLQGDYYIFVASDINNQVFEYVPSVNAEADNRDISDAMSITLSPPPDLVVSTVVAPLVAFSGQTVSLSWTVVNNGAGGTRAGQSTWYDDVWLSSDNTFGGNDTYLGFFRHDGGLAAGGSYNASGQVRLPIGISGDYYFIVRTDITNAVYEDAFEANNQTAETTPTEVLLAPPADLTVNSLTVPAAGTIGRSILVDYSVLNEGASGTPVSSWTDRIYLSPTPNLDASTAILISSRGHSGALAAGAAYSEAVNAVIPLNTAPGDYYVFVAADSQNQVFEIDNANNIVGSVATVSITAQFADLQISNFTSPPVAEAGTGVPFSWTILNAGTGDSIVRQWTDRLVLSADNVLGNGDDLVLINELRTELLGPAQSYTVAKPIGIPQSVAAGQYNLFLATDANNQVAETDNANNSNAFAPVSITITRQTPDLQVTGVTVPLNPSSRSTIPVQFTVQNLGTAATQATSWVDEIWLSLDDTIGSDDVLLAAVQRSGFLAINDTYTVNRSVTLPDVAGNYRIIVRTDRSNQVVEGPLDSNNDRASAEMAIGLAVVPDLQVTTVAAPANAFSGQPATIDYTVLNDGSDTDPGVYWYDTIYISQDATLDNADRAVGSFYRGGGLNAGQSYNASQSVDVPPGLSGQHFFIVRTDSSNRIFERDSELNNTAIASATTLQLLPPVDLVAGSIILPINGTPGQNASITYTVTNGSTQQAVGRWTDSLYLSTDPVWDINDKLFARYQKVGPLDAGDSYSPTVTAPLPGVTPGEYYLIVRSDILNQIVESDENNNLSASLNGFALDVPALVLDTPSIGTLAPNQGVYYRVDVPAGETLLVDFDAATTNGSTQLFVKFGDVPTRSTFDFGYTEALNADQKIIVPKTQAGTYYILAYGDSLSAETNFSLEARILQFDVIETNYGIGGNGGKLTLQMNGAKFDRSITPTLVSPGGAERAASQVFFTSANRLYATFDLTGLTPNAYDVKLTKSGGETVVVPDGLQVVAARAAQARPVIFGPSSTGAGALFQFTVSWGNDGINDVPAPLLTVAADRPIGQNPAFIDAPGYTFIGVPQDDGPAGIIRAGKTSQREFYAINGPRGGSTSVFADRLIDDTEAAYPWDEQRLYFVSPDDVGSEFDAAFAQMVADVGPTWGDFLNALGDSASLMPAAMGNNYLDTSVLQINFLRASAKVSTSISGKIYAPEIEVPIASRSVVATNIATGETFSTYSWNDGTFVLDRMKPGTYALTYGGGLVVAGGTVTVADNEHKVGHVVTVERGATVRGTVRGPGNVALEGVLVSIVDSENNVIDTATTDENGGYSILGLSGGNYTVFADSPGLARQSSTFAIADEADFVANLTLVNRSRATGTVVSPVGPNTPTTILLQRLPLSGSPADTFRPTVVGASFDFANLPAGDYKLTVDRQGYIGTSTTFTLGAQQTLNLGSLVLGQGAAVSGTVTSLSPSIDPVGQLVGVYDGDTAVGSAQVDTDGTFRILGLPAGNYVVKVAIVEGFSDEIPITLSTGQQVSNLNLSLAVGGEISGTVTAQISGLPLSGLVVTLADTLGNLRNTSTDEAGNYSFTGLPVGAYSVRSFGINESATISSLSSPPVDVDLQYQVAGSISGRLTNTAGDPVRGAVRVYKDGNLVGSVFNNVAGDYQILFAGAGTYVLQPESVDGSFDSVTRVVSGGADLTQNFVTGDRSIAVNVSSVPATVRIERVTPLGKVDVAFVTIESAGTVAFGSLVAGTYDIRVISDAGTGFSQTVVLGATDVVVNAALAAEGALSGTITGLAAAPLAGARVVLVTGSGDVASLAVTGIDGAYTIGNVPNGIYTLVVYADGKETVVSTGFAVSGTTAYSTQLVAGTGSINGRLVDGTGVPIAGGHVSLTSADGSITYGTAVVEADGTFQLSGPTGSDLTLRITSRGVAPVTQTGLNILAGVPVVLGDVATAALFFGSDGPAGAVGPGSIAFATPLSVTTLDAPTDGVPGFLTAIENSLVELTRLGNHVTYDQVLPIDDCLKCLNARVTLLNRIALQDRWFDLYEEAQDILGRNVLEAIAAFSLDFARNAGIIPKLILTFEGLAAFAATLGPAALLAEVPAASAGALGLGAASSGLTLAYAITQMLEAAVNLGRLMSDVLSASSAEGALSALQAMNTGAINLNQLLTNVVGVLTQSVKAGAVGALGDIYAFIVGGEDLLAQLRFQLLQDVLKDLIASQARFDNARTQYVKSVVNAFAAMKAYNKCLANAKNKECDPSDPVYDYPPDVIRFIPVFTSSDPNDILGPAGFGPQKFVPSSIPLDYTIRFENEVAAEAPAQVVTITQTLDSDLDARTFRLGDFGFSGQFFDVPVDSSFFQTRLDLRDTRGIYLDVVAGIDLLNNQAFWRFISVDPATGDVPVNPLMGFLPVNTSTPEGEGFVQYTIRAKAGAQTGDVIDAAASIVFDKNGPIDTPPIFNTLDVAGPASSIDPLPGVSAQDFVVFWNGDDDANGSAIESFDIYVSTDGGAYELWLDNTLLRQATFTGQNGSSYAFYSVAVDNAGNVEGIPVAPDTTTTVGGVVNTPPTLDLDEAAGASDEGSNFTRTGTATDPDVGDVLTAEVDYGTGAGFVPLALDGSGGFTLASTYADNGVYTVIVRVTDAALESVTKQFDITVSNVAPTIAAIDNQVVTWDGTGGTFTVGGSFLDPGADTFTGEINYGSGFVPLTLNPDGSFSLSNRYTTPGLYTVTVRVTDDDTGIGERTFDVRLLPPPPMVSSIAVNDGAAQRSRVTSLTVTFDHAITNLPASAVSVALRTPGGPVPIGATIVVTQADVDGKVWTITFTGAGLEAGSLADGVYDVSIDQTQVADSFAQVGTGTSSVMFHRLFGDSDGDRDTDALDLNAIRAITNKPASFLWYFDNDNDGDVDANDFAAGRLRVNKKLFA